MSYSEKDFNRLLQDYMVEGLEVLDTYNPYGEMIELITSQKVERRVVIQCISSNFTSSNSQQKLRLINFMYGLTMQFDSYPELFWIIASSDILFDSAFNGYSDRISRVCMDTMGSSLTIKYLCYCLLTHSERNLEVVIQAFYPVGHTIESLKIVEQVLAKPDQDNLKLYEFTYRLANRSLDRLRENGTLNTEEKNEWIKFFERGMQTQDSSITIHCELALLKLED